VVYTILISNNLITLSALSRIVKVPNYLSSGVEVHRLPCMLPGPGHVILTPVDI